MRILVLSDIHERVSKLISLRQVLENKGFKPDLVVIAGDLTYFKTVDIALRVIEKVRDIIGSTVLFIPGNCDSPELLAVKKVGSEAVNIHNGVIDVNGYVFAGIGGSGVTPFNTLIEFTEEEFQEMLENIILQLKDVDKSRVVMVTHSPIYGYFDRVDSENTGSRVFREYLDTIKPVMWITGHIHEHSGWLKVNKTVIVHPGPFMKGYYGLVELEDSEVKYVEVSKTS